jgi:starch synthase
MSGKTKVLFASFEAVPFIKTGGLGDVAGTLPAYIKNDEYDVRVILPLLSVIPDQYRQKMRYVTNYMVPLSWRSQYCGLFTMRRGNVTYYFLDNEFYFKRKGVYGEGDDGERVAFFSAAVLETIKHIRKNFPVDILHCNDWHTALGPVYLHEKYRGSRAYDSIKTVFTIHNLKFQGQYDQYIIGDILGLHDTPAAWQLVSNNAVNFLQGAVIYSDAVTTVSPTYADEICTPQFGEGLDGLFRSRKYKLSGIINGIDRDHFDPEHDKEIAANFTADKMENKLKCKLALQKELGLKEDPDVPLFAMVSRLTHQKGADLITALLPEFKKKNMQIAILGTGDAAFEKALEDYAAANSDWFAAKIAFDEPLSKRFYAGADVFLMPSEFDPCGLAQMISMRYGTLPLVRETGGLKDTVKGYWDYGEEANGFSFKDFDTNGLQKAVELALELWDKKDTWRKMQLNAMGEDFSWNNPAEDYRKLYSSLR